MAVVKGRYGSGPYYPEGYSSYADYLSDDNAESVYGLTWDTKPEKKPKKKESKPKSTKTEQSTPAYTPTTSDVAPVDFAPVSAAQPAAVPPPAVPPAPVINFSIPEEPYKPTVYNRQTAVNNRSLKIESGYKKPNDRGGTSGFKRSNSPRKFGSNAALRINKSLAV